MDFHFAMYSLDRTKLVLSCDNCDYYVVPTYCDTLSDLTAHDCEGN